MGPRDGKTIIILIRGHITHIPLANRAARVHRERNFLRSANGLIRNIVYDRIIYRAVVNFDSTNITISSPPREI